MDNTFKKKKNTLFDITNIYISLFCFYITQFAEYIFNGFLIGTLLFYLYSILSFLWVKMAAYKMSTDSEYPTQFVHAVSETFLILKIFDYVNTLNTNIILQKQLHLYSVLVHQIQKLNNIFTSISTKNSAGIFQYLSHIINYKDTIITDLISQIVTQNKLKKEYTLSNNIIKNNIFTTKFDDINTVSNILVNTNKYNNISLDLCDEYFLNTKITNETSTNEIYSILKLISL